MRPEIETGGAIVVYNDYCANITMDHITENLKNSILDGVGIGKSGVMAPTVYETAWLGRIPSEVDVNTPAYPPILGWLKENQHPDGSWGGEIEFIHDRIISTLAATLALLEWRGSSYWKEDTDPIIVERGLRYVSTNAEKLEKEEPFVGFEVLVPALLESLDERGFKLTSSALNQYKSIREKKLSLIPPEAIYSKASSVCYSLEFLGDDLDIKKVSNLQEENGSVAYSPGATAYLLTKCPDNTAARRYIERVIEDYDGKSPIIYPFDMTEIAWCIWNMLIADMTTGGGNYIDPRLYHHIIDLKEHWEKGEGISYCSESKMIDIDDMSIVYTILKLAGFDPDPSLLYQFEQEDYFATYSFERGPSISSNIHVLMALKEDSKAADKILRWLRSCRIDGHYWVDKWNISPYYSTAHAIIAVADIDREMAGKSVEWILNTQRDDGGWGYFKISTAEETAYCLQALSIYDQLAEPVDRRVFIRGREGLFAHVDAMPPIWIGKCLFAPIKMVESALYSALTMISRYVS